MFPMLPSGNKNMIDKNMINDEKPIAGARILLWAFFCPVQKGGCKTNGNETTVRFPAFRADSQTCYQERGCLEKLSYYRFPAV